MNGPSPVDEIAHQDGVLMAEVTRINTQLGRYVLRFLDADAGQAADTPPADERALADRVAAMAAELRGRAERREHCGDSPPLVGHAGER